MESPSALGIKKVYSIEFVVDYFDRSRDFYRNKMGLLETHQSTRDWEDKFKSKAIYFTANDIKIMVSSPLTTHSYTAQYLKTLCPGVCKVVLQVENLDRTIDYLQDHYATFVHREKEVCSPNSRHHFITIASPIGFVEFTFLEIEGNEDEIPMFETISSPPNEDSPFNSIDHITINARTIYPIYNFFEQVMDFKKFWSVSFHTPDFKSGKKGTGLFSQVMYDPGSHVKFASNEPLNPHFNDSQIQTFVYKNHGAGIQHIALGVDNLVDAVKHFRSRGIEFLPTPDTYYDMLPERMAQQQIGNLREDLADLKEQGILVDGENGKYLLQIFLKDASLLYQDESAGPFFYEIIQRCGHGGFGEGNFRALFEAIELQEPVR
ncbi:VOC family protein [Candidatus Nitronereus thalassa]|uniref:VOC family protein n=1 Tax=Candidatus Nitronereus thalassa TaxID=3020898 RepID=A0ABU3K4K8_9BACT|nr:VOC family protein [Candidatus Nitronereus thalassa]MDT7041288.1 VOC family protein [Candidatus Nitronereus thalassa]